MNQIQSFMYHHNDLMFAIKAILLILTVIIIVGVLINYAYVLEGEYLDTLSCSQILERITLDVHDPETSVINYYVERCVNKF